MLHGLQAGVLPTDHPGLEVRAAAVPYTVTRCVPHCVCKQVPVCVCCPCCDLLRKRLLATAVGCGDGCGCGN